MRLREPSVDALRRQELRDPKVEHLHERATVAAPREPQVRRLDVPMYDARGVSFGEGIGRLEHAVDGEHDRQGRGR